MRGGWFIRLWRVVGLLAITLAATTSFAAAECTTSFLREIGEPPEAFKPRDASVDVKGNVWVAVSGHVQEFNPSGEFITQFSVLAEGSLDLDAEGNIWFASGTKVREYKQNGELILEFGSSGNGNGQFFSISGIAIDPSGNVWVLDRGVGEITNRVQKFNSKGEYLSQFGKEGTGNGQFKTPEAIAADSEGNILVADTGNNRVEEFNSTGEFVRKYGSEGTGNGQFKTPRGIAVDSESKVWVVDSGNKRIERFSAKGAYLSQFGSSGSGNGQFNEPRGLAVSGSNIWVADMANNRVQELSCL